MKLKYLLKYQDFPINPQARTYALEMRGPSYLYDGNWYSS